MSNYASRAYATVGVNTAIESASPHKLILMLYDGLLKHVRMAKAHVQKGEVAAKAAAICKAVNILDQGLRLGLNLEAGGDIAAQLDALYDYSERRLFHANLHNDIAALDEVTSLIEPLRSAWFAITPDANAARPAAAPPR
jgi:flagellar protein FliS